MNNYVSGCLYQNSCMTGCVTMRALSWNNIHPLSELIWFEALNFRCTFCQKQRNKQNLKLEDGVSNYEKFQSLHLCRKNSWRQMTEEEQICYKIFCIWLKLVFNFIQFNSFSSALRSKLLIRQIFHKKNFALLFLYALELSDLLQRRRQCQKVLWSFRINVIWW